MLKGKEVILGVTGSIAAYKSAEIVRELIKQGAKVQVVMTKAATAFITPLSLQTLSGRTVITDLFSSPSAWEIEHVSLAERADLILIAPATANIIGKIAGGIADDMLSTLVLAARSPILIAPAMNEAMYENPILKANIEKLKNHGFCFIEPEEGDLACGKKGKGRLASIETIIRGVLTAIRNPQSTEQSAVHSPQSTVGSPQAIDRGLFRNPKSEIRNRKILITAGPTQEPIDPVRYISNPSSGRMGLALAEAAHRQGGEVIVVTGPIALEPPPGVTTIRVQTAQQMREAVMEHFSSVDIFISAAAVSDYQPEKSAKEKIKKTKDRLTLELVKTPDILAEVGQVKGENQIVVGFAAETEDLEQNARKKLEEKDLDLIVANDLTREGAGFGGETNMVTMITRSGEVIKTQKLPKIEVAEAILEQVSRISKRSGIRSQPKPDT
ncbi:MAG: bifunctional phosphopantothenoylcysteine decarboxylase/phosphopantothenate--cysteine ligase CoaBC [bacterium]|nr:bifunctional phosphopantothenoylcysteine decarboxylase/phosphopantothenate--cysteine ligase CoaBC [bacterium]